MHLTPVILEGRHVRLEPLGFHHLDALVDAGREWDITPERMRDGIASALRQQAEGTTLPFATVNLASGEVAGSTRFLRFVPEHRRVEIGSTWVGAPWRRTAVNTEAKLLMLEHAFERLGCVRVELMADALNEVSRAAILRLGATEEGTFRNYLVAGGEVHDAVFYSIIDAEWPAVRARLHALLSRR